MQLLLPEPRNTRSVEPKVYTKEREQRGIKEWRRRNRGHTKPGWDFTTGERPQFQRKGKLSSVQHHFQEKFPCILGTKKWLTIYPSNLNIRAVPISPSISTLPESQLTAALRDKVVLSHFTYNETKSRLSVLSQRLWTRAENSSLSGSEVISFLLRSIGKCFIFWPIQGILSKPSFWNFWTSFECLLVWIKNLSPHAKGKTAEGRKQVTHGISSEALSQALWEICHLISLGQSSFLHTANSISTTTTSH